MSDRIGGYIIETKHGTYYGPYPYTSLKDAEEKRDAIMAQAGITETSELKIYPIRWMLGGVTWAKTNAVMQ